MFFVSKGNQFDFYLLGAHVKRYDFSDSYVAFVLSLFFSYFSSFFFLVPPGGFAAYEEFSGYLHLHHHENMPI